MGDHWAEGSLTLLAVVVLAVYLLFLARRAGFGGGRRSAVGRLAGPVETLARLPLEARRSIYVVRIVDQILIVGASEGGMCKLGQLPADALKSEGSLGDPLRFADALRAAVGRPVSSQAAAAFVPQPAPVPDSEGK